jgi:serine/threonine-protein kinase
MLRHHDSYELLLEIASGGMANVHVARHSNAAGFECLVIVKRIHRHLSESREFSDMLREEGRVASLVRHPNVVPVINVLEADGELLLVQEYVEGVTLATLWRAAVQAGRRVPPGIGARILSDALSGLHAAHEAVDMLGQRLDVVHRDVSPQNVLVGVDGVSRVIDFGIAKARFSVAETRSGWGKDGYVAPEQALRAAVDRRADLFAAGVVLHELLTGERFFRRKNDAEETRTVPKPSSLVPHVSPSLDAVVARATQRDPANRFQTASSFLEALQRACPPAPAVDVAALVAKHCGEGLSERRRLLAEILNGARPVEGRPDRPPSERVSTDAAETTTLAVSGTPLVEWPRARNVKGRTAAAVAVIAGLLLLRAASSAFGSSARESKVRPEASRAPAPASAAPHAARELARSDDRVSINLLADRVVQSVHGNGVRSVELRGRRVRLAVAPWSGKLAIDAVLAGGRTGHAEVDESGSYDVALVTSRARRLAPRPVAARSSAATDLEPNPYGQP